MLFFKKEIFCDKKSVPGRHSLYFLIATPFMNLLENKMPPNVALVLCFVVGIPAVIDCLTGIILACGKAPKIIWRINFFWYKEPEAFASLVRLLLK